MNEILSKDIVVGISQWTPVKPIITPVYVHLVTMVTNVKLKLMNAMNIFHAKMEHLAKIK
jgi:hypothetical protein